MDKIKVMVSSVVRNLEGERDSILRLFQQDRFPFIELVGANPYDMASLPESSGNATVKMARDCDLYILVLGKDYGMETEEGKSATEVEYDAATKMDPTKVLVFLKNVDEEIDEKQQAFIRRVSDYYNGYFRTSFQYTHELQEKVEASFWKWLISRAQVGKYQTYVDHFIRMVKEDVQYAGTQLYYQTTEQFVEITVLFNRRELIQHIDVSDLMFNFWSNVNKVRREVNHFLEGNT